MTTARPLRRVLESGDLEERVKGTRRKAKAWNKVGDTESPARIPHNEAKVSENSPFARMVYRI